MKPYTQALLAIIALVVAGCTAIEKPSTPVDLRGPEGVRLSDGTELIIKNTSSGEATVREREQGQRNQDLSRALSLKMKILETENGKIKEVKVSDAGGVIMITEENTDKTEENPVAGKVVTGVRSGGAWRWQEKNGATPQHEAEKFLDSMMNLMAGNSRELMPEKPVMADHSWELKGSEREYMINKLQAGNERIFLEEKIENCLKEADLKMFLKFNGIEQRDGERCAHIAITIKGEGDVDGMTVTARGSGVFVRSLESGLVLQHKIKLRLSASGTITERGERATIRMSATNDTTVTVSKPEEQPEKTNPEPEKPAESKE